MIHRLITQWQGKAEVRRMCRVLDVSRSGFYAARRRQRSAPRVCFRACMCVQPLRPAAAMMAAAGYAQPCGTKVSAWAASGPHTDAASWAQSPLATQVHPHRRQPAQFTSGRQCAGSMLQSECWRSGLGLRYHVHPHSQRLAVSGRGHGPVLAQDRRLAHGPDAAGRAGLSRAANGDCTAQTQTWADRAFGSWMPVRQPSS